MYKLVNGEKMEMTAEEIAALQEETKLQNAVRQNQPMTESDVIRMLIAQQINTLSVDDNTAVRMREFYPDWSVGQAYTAGYKVQHGGKLWRCVQAHTSQTGWEPENAPALWTEICESHAGTLDDPIPYSGNMALTAGLYYVQDYTIYLCNRDTGNPVYNTLAELVGLYVETV